MHFIETFTFPNQNLPFIKKVILISLFIDWKYN